MDCITRAPLRFAALALGALLFADCLAAVAATRAEEPDTWYVEGVAQGTNGFQVSHFWSKGRKLRSESVVAGHLVMTFVSGDTYYAIDGLSGVGVAIQRSPKALAADAKGGRPMANEGRELIARGAEKVGTERIGGREVVVYRLTDAQGKHTAWVTNDPQQLLVKLETFRRGEGESATTIFNYERGLEIPDSFFEPDARFTLERMTYQDYLTRIAKGPVGPVPVIHTDLLVGE
ncbi:MAG TPA: hypothetical protein VMW35_10080 [Myxococcota bacterium]|jgi:hypothetical protein|nr:hypothetical protein [Myxococcota bacterium]